MVQLFVCKHPPQMQSQLLGGTESLCLWFVEAGPMVKKAQRADRPITWLLSFCNVVLQAKNTVNEIIWTGVCKTLLADVMAPQHIKSSYVQTQAHSQTLLQKGKEGLANMVHPIIVGQLLLWIPLKTKPLKSVTNTYIPLSKFITPYYIDHSILSANHLPPTNKEQSILRNLPSSHLGPLPSLM